SRNRSACLTSSACCAIAVPTLERNSCRGRVVYNSSGSLALQPHRDGSMAGRADEADSDSEDEEEVGSRQAAADMETTSVEPEEEEEKVAGELGSDLVQLYPIPPRGRRAAPLPANGFQQHGDGAKQELAATSAAMVCGLCGHFFPLEHAKGLAVACARPLSRPVMANGCQPCWTSTSYLPNNQVCGELSSEAADPAKQTTMFWHYLAGQPITKADISEYIKLAELAPVMAPGSVEEERMSSAMAYLKDYSQQAYRCSSQGCWPFTSGLTWLVRSH
ncbi:hypothetical protein QJQ45_029877, partial [Haematococcus lacustris]